MPSDSCRVTCPLSSFLFLNLPNSFLLAVPSTKKIPAYLRFFWS